MGKVLVVDDDIDILAVVEGALEAEGHRVVALERPGMAASRALEFDPDAVVLDINMPEISGFDVLDQLRAQPATSAIPVLFLSALGDSPHRVEGLKRGAEDYLAKPFSTEELVLRVGRLCEARKGGGAAEAPSIAALGQALEHGDFDRHPVFFGRYRATAKIGQGGMGLVLEGLDTLLGRRVAIKTLRVPGPVMRVEDARLSELAQEAAVLARFRHPHIVTVHDVGRVGEGVPFVVLELVDGQSLHEAMREGEPLSIDRTLEIAAAVAAGLTLAAEARVVHGDLKPGNILLGKAGEIKIVDFGVSRLAGHEGDDGPRVFGTPGFVAPEILIGDQATPAVDVYALGEVLYRCLTGRASQRARGFYELMSKTVSNAPEPMGVGLPEDLVGLVLTLLEKEPEDRLPAAEVESRLRALRSALPADVLATAPAESLDSSMGETGRGQWIRTSSIATRRP